MVVSFEFRLLMWMSVDVDVDDVSAAVVGHGKALILICLAWLLGSGSAVDVVLVFVGPLTIPCVVCST